MDYIDRIEQMANSFNEDMDISTIERSFTDAEGNTFHTNVPFPKFLVDLDKLGNFLGTQYDKVDSGESISVLLRIDKDSMDKFTSSPVGQMWLFSCITKEFLADPRCARASIPLMKKLIKYIRGCILMAEVTIDKKD